MLPPFPHPWGQNKLQDGPLVHSPCLEFREVERPARASPVRSVGSGCPASRAPASWAHSPKTLCMDSDSEIKIDFFLSFAFSFQWLLP